MDDELHNRLDREHTDALLKDYSADYETWLEEKVAQLEVENEHIAKFASFFYGEIHSDDWPYGAYKYYQHMPNECAVKMDDAFKE